MPEFVMEGRDHAARAESEFVFGFIEAMFFTETSHAFDSGDWFTEERRAASEAGQADGELPGDVGYMDLHPDALEAIRRDCNTFWILNRDALESACESDGYDMRRAGSDYWFTRNGHGVGFWDRDLGDVGDMLSDAARDAGEVHVWFGDHVEHGDAPFVHVDL